MPALRVHHLNTATMCPLSARLVNGQGGWFEWARMVCHCFLVETDRGLLLVDTGLGSADLADPIARLGKQFVRVARPRCDPEELAVAQVARLGFRPEEVRFLVPTHLDLDHAGGFVDFPWAAVQVFHAEHAAAMSRATARERQRYRPAQWAHGPRWVLREESSGEGWNGFDGVQAIDGNPDVLLIPLQGHTRGHCGVAVRTASGWLLHAGDAYFHHQEMAAEPHCPAGLRWFQRLVAMDNPLRLRNQDRLRALVQGHPEVRVVCAHDAQELEQLSR